MPKKQKPRSRGPSPVTQIWLIQQFDSLHKEHALILDRIKQINPAPSNISPELEQQILRSRSLSSNIDAQVPDK